MTATPKIGTDEDASSALVTWWSHGQVRAHLVDLRTLKDRMRETPPHIVSPWINIRNNAEAPLSLASSQSRSLVD
jgi:hypothetical protein